MLNFSTEDRLLNRAYLHYLLLGVASYMFFQLAPFIDAVVVSKTLGDHALSAIGLSIPFFYFLNFIATLVGYGAGAKISQAKGAGETVRAYRTFTRAALVLGSASLLCMVLGVCLLPEIVAFLGGTPENSVYAQDYVRIVTWGAPPYLIGLASFFMLYNDGAPKLAVTGACVCGVFNVILDLILVLHCGLGIKGAAIGMVGGRDGAMSGLPFPHTAEGPAAPV